MKTVYLFSNFDNNNGFTEEVGKSIKANLLERNSLVFIVSSPNGFDKSDFYYNVVKKWFFNIGIEFSNYYLIDNRIDKYKAIDLIEKSSCIFLMGGITREQFAYIKNNGFLQSLQRYNGIIMGISAGAINLAENSLSIGYPKDPESIMYKGIGITNKTIHPHFSVENIEELIELKKFSQNNTIYGLCDFSAIVENDNTVKMFGNIYEIKNNVVKKIN